METAAGTGRRGGRPDLGSRLGLEPLARTTRREQVLDALRDAVSGGRLPPGTHLPEVELSESLGVSRGTLREALRHLQQEGLLVPDARGRLSVRVVTAQEVADIFAVRGALEALAAEAVCAQPPARREPVVQALRAQLGRMQRPGADFAEQVREDLGFHELLCRVSGNATLLESWQGVGGLARVAVTAAGEATALANMAVDRHAPVVELLAAGDGGGAREYLVDHMTGAASQVVAHLRSA